MMLEFCEVKNCVCEQRLDTFKVGYGGLSWLLYQCSACKGYHYHHPEGHAVEAIPIPQWVLKLIEQRNPDRA